MRITSLNISLIAAIISLCSCEKVPPVKIPEAKAILSVKLDPSFLGAGKVDSAFATWEVNGFKQKIKMNSSNDSLIVNMESLQEATGIMSIEIFSNKKFNNQYYSQWLINKEASVQKKASLNFIGPTSFFDTDWMPRVSLTDYVGHNAVIGLRPDDAYFLIKDVQPGIHQLTIEKGYWKLGGGIQRVGYGIWNCLNDCTNATGDAEDNAYFDFLYTQVGVKPWNHIEISVLYQINQQGEGWIISLTYDP